MIRKGNWGWGKLLQEVEQSQFLLGVVATVAGRTTLQFLLEESSRFRRNAKLRIISTCRNTYLILKWKPVSLCYTQHLPFLKKKNPEGILFIYFCFLAVMKFEPRAVCKLDKYSTIELCSQPLSAIPSLFLETCAEALWFLITLP